MEPNTKTITRYMCTYTITLMTLSWKVLDEFQLFSSAIYVFILSIFIIYRQQYYGVIKTQCKNNGYISQCFKHILFPVSNSNLKESYRCDVKLRQCMGFEF